MSRRTPSFLGVLILTLVDASFSFAGCPTFTYTGLINVSTNANLAAPTTATPAPITIPEFNDPAHNPPITLTFMASSTAQPYSPGQVGDPGTDVTICTITDAYGGTTPVSDALYRQTLYYKYQMTITDLTYGTSTPKNTIVFSGKLFVNITRPMTGGPGGGSICIMIDQNSDTKSVVTGGHQTTYKVDFSQYYSTAACKLLDYVIAEASGKVSAVVSAVGSTFPPPPSKCLPAAVAPVARLDLEPRDRAWVSPRRHQGLRLQFPDQALVVLASP